MIPFALLAGLMLAGALLWVLFPLFSTRRQVTAGEERQRQTETALAVLREQLAELDAERAAGRLDDAAYARNREELERRALDEGQGGEGEAHGGPARAWGLGLLLAVPLLAGVVYLAVGEPDALDPAKRAGEAGFTAAEIEQMVGGLAARLENEPDNVEGWTMLARSYLVLQDFPKALGVYARLAEMRPQDPSVFADWADVLAATREGDVTGEPEMLLARALELDPDHLKANALVGTAAYQHGDYAKASAHWERVLAQVPAEDSETAATIRASINEARARGGLPALSESAVAAPPAASAGGLALRGRLALAEGLRERVAPEDVVFVFVRPAGGGMPLAALRFTAGELPREFDFAGAPLMTGDAPIPAQLHVVARVSKSGDVGARPGDLEGQRSGVAADAAGVELLIDTVRE
ncbi:c-type cytochrome biogenesis protein CcmI [Pseudothauera nasutitermitis]|uniref:C-type cytochrome biogenesis protein CcmI n=1 Tax=Pseudothauera nasutitermitis TaxID=2565930 RepID=A0A4V3WAY0_9RHOO|nr:c-type cytochrome biogenesis protein CcmI [Pseudothauera nasutitermitis]THF61120.1 c-type cytochrome biogenesis protein CcmI [Pseudothauera nasutitermitis]